MPATVLPPRRTVPRPVPRDRREEERAPTPPSPSSPIREISPTFSILDGHEGDGSFSGATPSCVKLARSNIESLDWDHIRRIIAPHRARIHHPSRPAHDGHAQVLPTSRRTDPTGFFELLTQPYVELPPPPTPKPWIRPSDELPSHIPNHPNPRRLPEFDVDEEELTDPDADLPKQIHYEIVYTPHGRYAWAAGQPVGKLRLLAHVHSAQSNRGKWSTDMMFGLIGGRPMTFMCKSWSRHQDKTRFLPEFKLLSSDSYLRPLQGLVVPYVINLYNTQDTIQLFMEAPHQSFWVEASPTMSDALKQRVVDAYRKLHGAGVLHGSVEKNNILIGGDGRVTLVDFSMARTKRPIKEIGLEGCTDKDLALELRKVKFMLDYGHARSHETQGWERGDRHAPKPEVWGQWTQKLDQPSKRWLVPGQTQEMYADAVSVFRANVARLEHRRAVESVSPLLVLSPEFPLPVRNRLPSHVVPSKSPHKRKLPPHLPDGTATPAKRPRVNDKELERPVCSGPLWEYKTTSYTAGKSDLLPASESSAEAAAPPAVKVRDFASQPYDGPRGYYVPHPPTELIMSSYRAADIRNTNAIRCGRLGLPYWRGDADDDSLAPPGYIRPLPRGQGLKISLGALKRQRDGVESGEEIRSPKRTRLDLPAPLHFSEDWEVFLERDTRIRFDDRISVYDPCSYLEVASEVSGSSQGQGQNEEIKVESTVPLFHPSHRGTPKPTRPILKLTSAPRTVAWDLNAWPHPPDEEILTTPILEQCGLLPPPGVVPSLSLPRASAPTSGTSSQPDPRTTALDLAPSHHAPADATSTVNGDGEAQVSPPTRLLPCQTETHRRAPAVQLQPQLTPEEMEDFEAWQVENLLDPGWDPALSPQANLLAIANSEGATPYRMDTDVCRWLTLGQGTRRP